MNRIDIQNVTPELVLGHSKLINDKLNIADGSKPAEPSNIISEFKDTRRYDFDDISMKPTTIKDIDIIGSKKTEQAADTERLKQEAVANKGISKVIDVKKIDDLKSEGGADSKSDSGASQGSLIHGDPPSIQSEMS